MIRLLDFLTRLPHTSKKTALLILVVAAATMIVSTIVSLMLSRFHNLHILSLGTIEVIGVEAYWDANLQKEAKQVEWGTIYLGSSNSTSLYVRSISNVNITLELKTANWTFLDSRNITVSGPSDSTPYMNLTWNYNNASISPDETVQVTLTLSADDSPDFIQFLVDNDVKNFSFDIIIRASEEH